MKKAASTHILYYLCSPSFNFSLTSNMDGMAANVGSIWCNAEAKRRGCKMLEVEGGGELADLPDNVTVVGKKRNLMREIQVSE